MAEWIRAPRDKFIDSLSQNVNFLFQHERVFIMDNHLSAAWCWLNYLNTDKTYNLFHIDRHDDLLSNEEAIQEEVLDKLIDVGGLTFEAYTGLLNPAMKDMKLFQWDNYIVNTHLLYPRFFGERFFATHEECRENRDFVQHNVSMDELVRSMPYWIKRYSTEKWIINLDMDYFFGEFGDDTIQYFTDEYIICVAKSIKKIWEHVAIFTICLSPDFCVDWENAYRTTQLVCRELEIPFSLKKEYWSASN